MCQINEILGDDLMNQLSPHFTKGYPNAYTLTKALAEEAIKSMSGNLPICIFRPGIGETFFRIIINLNKIKFYN